MRTMTLVMLYQTTVNPDSIATLDKLRTEFDAIYRKHGIEVIGHWKKVESPNVSYYMVKYVSEADYQHKVRALKEDDSYVDLTKQLRSIRTDIKAERLIPPD